MASVSVGGTQVSYSNTGKGPPLVLLHGTGGDGQSSFGHLVDQFADAFTVLALDYAGCGNSTIPDGELSLPLLVEQVAAVIADAGGQPADVVGHSLGAQVAAALTARQPALVRRLVLAGSRAGGDARHHMVFDTWARLQALDPRLADHFMLSLAIGPEFLRSQGAAPLHHLLHRPLSLNIKKRIELSRDIDIRSDLPKITAPTLVIGMTRDYLVPVHHAKEVHALISGSQYVEFDCGHAVFREAREPLVARIRTFLMEPL